MRLTIEKFVIVAYAWNPCNGSTFLSVWKHPLEEMVLLRCFFASDLSNSIETRSRRQGPHDHEEDLEPLRVAFPVTGWAELFSCFQQISDFLLEKFQKVLSTDDYPKVTYPYLRALICKPQIKSELETVQGTRLP